MKILFFTDSHLRSNSDRPKWRVDNHYESQFQELNEIKNIAKIHKVDLIISGGDTLHHPDVSHALLTDVMAWIKNLSCSFYSIVGNHDCHGFCVDETNNALNVLFESGLVTKLEELVFEKDKIVIRGIPAYLDSKKGNYIFEEKYKDYFKIIVTHNYITKVPQIFNHYLTKDVVTNANIVLSGHLHQGFSDIQKNTQFVNPGSLSRWSINEQHKPKVLILDTDTNTVIPIELQSSKEPFEIFDIQAVMEIKSSEMNLQNFVDSLEGASFENIEVEQVVLAEGKKQQVAQDIIDMALSKVRLAKEELK